MGSIIFRVKVTNRMFYFVQTDVEDAHIGEQVSCNLIQA